ncbi:MAG: SpoVA/SpoVAEb family sporulation membrane protein [Christensenellaceae bacterium]|jgi:stage V sporulation protein AE|nr:SpoVA/SpoVAEb family sporulation membrane protein [Christensenellaceae bacterium]
MEIFMDFLLAFAVGGFICMLGQLLILITKWTSARILVSFVCLGALLQVVGLFKILKEFSPFGVSVPITGFGAGLAEGAIKAVKEDGFFGIFSGGFTAVAAGLAVAITSAFIVALIFKSHSK